MATKAQVAKQKRTPKFQTRKYNRCRQCGRPRGYLKKFELCRICFRSL
ncbi:MAG: type Z 30S ribosomal protein S14, partial [Candidatus Poribacteria bacterium]|nr:type Z 30S ribosomal protein S14 [Candidatus Poribacteria bacterium]